MIGTVAVGGAVLAGCAMRDATVTPSNAFADHAEPRRTDALPRLVLQTTEEGVIGVPVGWRVAANRGGRMQQSIFELIPPGRGAARIVVRAIVRSTLADEPVGAWLGTFAAINSWPMEDEVGQIRAVAASEGCPRNAHCVEARSRVSKERYAACAVEVAALVVVAYIYIPDAQALRDLGGHAALARVAAAGGGIRP